MNILNRTTLILICTACVVIGSVSFRYYTTHTAAADLTIIKPLATPVVTHTIHESPLPAAVIDYSKLSHRRKRKLKRKAERERKNMRDEKSISMLSEEPTASSVPKTAYALGFSSLHRETEEKPLPILGHYPEWLRGSYIAVGPGVFENGSAAADLWLDGCAMLHRFRIDATGITYSNHLLKTAYAATGDFFSNTRKNAAQSSSVGSKLMHLMQSSSALAYDNTNVNVIPARDSYIALTDGKIACLCDKKNSALSQVKPLQGTVDAHAYCPHPLYDAYREKWYGLATTLGYNSTYTLYTWEPDTLVQTAVKTIQTPYAAYIHSFGMTDHYCIVIESPLVLRPYHVLMHTEYYFNNYFTWEPGRRTHIHLIPKDSNLAVTTYTTDAFFYLHHINAFEEEENIVIDLCAYDNPEIVRTFFLKTLRYDTQHTMPLSHFMRLTAHKKDKTIEKTVIKEVVLETPCINETYRMRPYRYLYSPSRSETSQFFDQLMKLDLVNNQCTLWKIPHTFITEARFVQAPHAHHEDDGVLVALALDTEQQCSFLVIIDATTMEEIARATVPHHIPFISHGTYEASQ